MSKSYTYQTTDYADIGEDHTNKFITKMVTSVHIGGLASGIYNDEG
jgi:hypothetical protein